MGGERGVGGWGVKKIARMLQLSSLSLCTIGSWGKEKEKGCCIETECGTCKSERKKEGEMQEREVRESST